MMKIKSVRSLAALTLLGNLCAGAAEQPTTYAPPPDDAQAVLRALMLKPQPVITPVPKLERPGAIAPVVPYAQEEVGAWQISKRERDQQTFSATSIWRDAATGRETRRVHEFVEIGTGLNYQDEKGEWQTTREEFQRTADGGFIAEFGPHLLVLEQNINSRTAVRFTSAEGQILSGPLAVGYFDPVDGRNVVLGTIRDTAGELTAPNEVTYRSAFDGIDASVRVTYRRAGMSADLVLNETPVSPVALGLSELSRLEMYTEFDPATTEPLQTVRILREETDPALRRQMLEPDFTDTVLDFGGYDMGTGSAFTSEEAGGTSKIPVGKRLSIIDGRPILIEAVEWEAAKKHLGALAPVPGPPLRTIPPAMQASTTRQNSTGQGGTANLAVLGGNLPPSRAQGPPGRVVAQASALANVPASVSLADGRIGTATGTVARRLQAGTLALLPSAGSPPHVASVRQLPVRLPKSTPKPVQEARATRRDADRSREFVLDYSLVSGATNFTFASDKTYFVKSDVHLYGNTVFESAVIKYTNSTAALRIKGTATFKTSEYTPLILTSQHDNSIGETLPWSTANPWTNYCGSPALEFNYYSSGQPASIQHIRISHAATAVSFFGGTGHELKHAQVVHCSAAFSAYYADARLRNVLVHLADRVATGSGAANATLRFEHLTASAANHLNYYSWSGPATTLRLTNSLFVAVTNTGTYSGANNASNTTSSAAFTVAGAGAHYLNGTSYRGLGTVNLNASLLADIRARTTQPPLLLTNGSLTTDTTLDPRAALRYAASAAPDLQRTCMLV